jgi:ankyrin repeat protein
MDDIATVQNFARIFVRGNITAPLDETALIQACRRGSVEMVLALLNAGADPLKMTEDGCSFYHWLFMLGDGVSSIVDKLLSLNSTRKNELLDQPCSRTYVLHQQWPLRLVGTPLAFAIECNSVPALKSLLKLGASPHARAFSQTETPPTIKWTPIHLAFKFHQAEILKLLLNKDSPFLSMDCRPAVDVIELAQSICYSTDVERMAMHGISRKKTALEETLMMIHPGVLSAPTKDGQTPFMQAIDFSNIDVVNAMIHADPTLYKMPFVDPEDEKVFTYPAIFAAQIAAKRDSSRAFEIVKLLLNCIPQDTKLRDSQGRTPLHLSVTGTSTLTTKWLLMNGYNVSDLDDTGRTPIYNCCTTASLDILLKLDASINQTDYSGLTPLHVAALQGSDDMVESLIFRNADLTIAGERGSALHCAVLAQSRRVMSFLLKANDGKRNKMDINAVDSNGDTALHLAARVLRPNLLHLLFLYRIDRSICNNARLTAKSQLETYHDENLQAVETMVDGPSVPPYSVDCEANIEESAETSKDKLGNAADLPWDDVFQGSGKPTTTEANSESNYDKSDKEWYPSNEQRTAKEVPQFLQTENENKLELLQLFENAEERYITDIVSSMWKDDLDGRRPDVTKLSVDQGSSARKVSWARGPVSMGPFELSS